MYRLDVKQVKKSVKPLANGLLRLDKFMERHKLFITFSGVVLGVITALGVALGEFDFANALGTLRDLIVFWATIFGKWLSRD